MKENERRTSWLRVRWSRQHTVLMSVRLDELDDSTRAPASLLETYESIGRGGENQSYRARGDVCSGRRRVADALVLLGDAGFLGGDIFLAAGGRARGVLGAVEVASRWGAAGSFGAEGDVEGWVARRGY